MIDIYKITVDLYVLDHLRIIFYSSIATVLTEEQPTVGSRSHR